MPVNTLLRHFDGVSQHGFCEIRLPLLFIQFGQQARRFKLDVVKTSNVLRQVPLEKKEKPQYETQ